MAISALPPKPKMTALVWAGRRRPKLAHACVEGQVRPGEQARDPDAEEHTHHPPGHGKHDADLAGVVIVMLQPFWRRLRCVIRSEHHKNQTTGNCQNDKAMHADWIAAPSGRHGQPNEGDNRENDDRELSFACCELCNHVHCPALVELNRYMIVSWYRVVHKSWRLPLPRRGSQYRFVVPRLSDRAGSGK